MKRRKRKKRKISMRIIYIVGKSSVGKDTIYKKLKEKIDIKPYVLYTTRPIRTGEEDGVNYYFLEQHEMDEHINSTEKNVIEYRVYNTIYGPWTYATIADNQFESEKDLLMEGTLESYDAVRKYFMDNDKVQVIPIYIEVDDGVRLERALKREMEQENPKYEELCRRFLADCKDFSEDKILNSGIKKRFKNINVDECVQDIIDYVSMK